MYDFLITSDHMVADPDALAACFIERLGVHGHAKWRLGPEVMPTGEEQVEHPFLSHFLRVNRDLAQAPTRLQTQAHIRVSKPVDPAFEPHLESLARYQGLGRPMMTHSVTVAYEDIVELAERLHDRRIPFRMAPMDEYLDFERLWTGITPEHPCYRPDVDGGLMFEFHPARPLGHPAQVWDEPFPEPADPEPGEMIRIESRGWVLRDLDATCRALADNLDWEPIDGTRTFPGDAMRRAQLGFKLRHSGVIDLIEPTAFDSEYGRYLHTWGPGPAYTRISVNGLDAKADDLTRRGTPFSWMRESDATGGRRIQVDPAALMGTTVEFVEWVPRG